MIIAVTNENGQIFQHFGHTQSFWIFEAGEGKILSRKEIGAGEEGHGALAQVLKENGVELLICGGIGGGARTALAQAGIQLISGATGDVTKAVEGYLAGSLTDSAAGMCTHHDHDHGEGHSCGEHSCGEHK